MPADDTTPPFADLPRIDEHTVTVSGPPAAAWDAVLRALGSAFGRPRARRIAAVLGCEPATTRAWDRPGVGSSVPGFRIVSAAPPDLLVVAGRHRFSRYGIVFRFEPAGEGTRCRAESRAEFPGTAGRVYRAAVIGTGGHAVAVRALLQQVRSAAGSDDRPTGR
ncbi:hypothetical protein [Modestobacter marinus]|uniref:hypothetical protein n=1 Tax=Modestobacter marinus TaxID=477641 RepID=UPI001C97D78C|nr:hypothetical protein [Modestobacter marinus]